MRLITAFRIINRLHFNPIFVPKTVRVSIETLYKITFYYHILKIWVKVLIGVKAKFRIRNKVSKVLVEQ